MRVNKIFAGFACPAIRDVTLSWANPRCINEEPSHQVWNFDIETAGTLPPNLVVGTLVDGRSAGNWQVIEMKQSLLRF
ncbi:MAG: hypothetical protein H0W49_07780 [Nitrospirales bacterium]|nr:hypothetical protein [Nitrospirales bacterium]